MADDLAATLADLADHLAELAKRDDRLRERLRALVLAVLAPADAPAGTPEPEPAPPQPGPIAEVAPDLPAPTVEQAPPPPSPATPPEPLRPLLLGQPRPRPQLPPPIVSVSVPDVVDELAGVEARCRLKAEGLRWAVLRRQIEAEGGDFRTRIAPKDRELLDRAGAIRCHLWMNRPEYSVPADPGAAETAARWFEALARSVELVRETGPDAGVAREHREPALDLLAEAQSALRVAVHQAGGPPNDDEQFRIYQWLSSVTKRERIFIRRHMRLDDPARTADPAGFVARVDQFAGRLRKGKTNTRKTEEYLKKCRFHARIIANHRGEDREHDWRKIAEAIDGLIKEGSPPSAIELRELLLPILDEAPDDLGETSPAFGRVLREIDDYLASRPDPTDADEAARGPTAEVARVARLLEGKVMVLIGGQCRPHARDALQDALKLKELDWISSREHTSIDRFEPNIARPDVALVALAIRWSSHSYGEVKQFCNDYGKPMVRLQGGYGVNKVAAEILDQCGDQLEGR